MTIPAGSIGNERDIVSVTERWYSSDLKMEVLRKTSDPRYGDTTFTVTNLTRAEPAKSLFEIPADYTVKDASAGAKVITDGIK
jgi:hypothetical protein